MNSSCKEIDSTCCSPEKEKAMKTLCRTKKKKKKKKERKEYQQPSKRGSLKISKKLDKPCMHAKSL